MKRLIDNMYNYSDHKLKKCLVKKRRNSVDILKKAVSPNIDFMDKQQYIEKEIDRRMLYY